MPAEHRFLRWLLPKRAFEAIKAGTKQWLVECPCGVKRDFWDEGGVRWGGVGEPRQYCRCEACDKGTWQKVRKKTDEERRQI